MGARIRVAPVRLPIGTPSRPAGPGTLRVGPADTPPARLRAEAVPPAWRDRLPAGWPLKYLLVAFPLWWVCGLSTLIFPLMAVPMALALRRQARTTAVSVPPGFWLWALFLAWQVIGLLLLGVSPPGTHPGSVSGRIVSLAFTLVEYAGVTVVLLYAGNLRGVTQTAIARWMGALFLTVCAGGFLGILAPHFSFRSVIELVLPASIARQAFVRSLVHPVAAQVQDIIGVGNGRPAAPFGYTNWWGNTLSIVLVWFVAAWVVPARGRRRLLYGALVAATAVPVVLSLNRGLWIGIVVTVVWVLGRQLLQGRIGAVLLVVGVGSVAIALAAVSPLGRVVDARLQHPDSDSIRSFVANLSYVAVRNSPIVGYGGNRHADGSAASIAIGPSAGCKSCGDVPTGSTGQLWSVLFDHGIVGALLFFGFFATVLWRYRGRHGAVDEAAVLTVMLGFVYMLFYTAVPVAPTLTMVAVAVLWRGDRLSADPPRRGDP